MISVHIDISLPSMTIYTLKCSYYILITAHVYQDDHLSNCATTTRLKSVPALQHLYIYTQRTYIYRHDIYVVCNYIHTSSDIGTSAEKVQYEREEARAVRVTGI